ncbi:MAG TPA: class I SAM-dependent methyltransferase [Vicinamibacterales bacterium]|jgi:SAM-dependent methyltransferase
MSGSEYAYAGTELDVFKHAHRWKEYWSGAIAPYLRGAMLEVGAGVGANTPYLVAPRVRRIVRLEPDPRFAERLERHRPPIGAGAIDVVDKCGVVADLAPDERFDVILYLDVLEHIDDDRAEMASAAAHLVPGGHLVVLAPAFQFLYSPFDKAIGHYRRYRRSTLEPLAPPALTLERSEYFDAPGAVLSAGNRLLLRSAAPTLAQIAFWDAWIVPIARITDRATRAMFGRSVLCVWRAGP